MLALAALALMAVGAQATAAQSCAKAKVPAAGKAASCRLKAAGVFLASAGGAADIEKRDAAYWRKWIAEGKEQTLMPAFHEKHGGPLSETQVESLVTFVLKNFPTEPVRE